MPTSAFIEEKVLSCLGYAGSTCQDLFIVAFGHITGIVDNKKIQIEVYQPYLLKLH